MLQTEYAFTLPKGYIDKDGNLHRQGVMRLANAKDEIAPLQDPRVQRNQAYLVVILSRASSPDSESWPTLTPASSRTSSPPTWPTCKTCIGASTRTAIRGSSSVARNARTCSRWKSRRFREANPRRDSALPLGPNGPGGSVHRLSLPLAEGRDHTDVPPRTPPVGRGDFAHQPGDQRGSRGVTNESAE